MNIMAGFLIGILIAFIVWLVFSAADREASQVQLELYLDLLERYQQQKTDKIDLEARLANDCKECKKCREGIEWDFRNE